MLIYFDSKDLINILERSDPVSRKELGKVLQQSDARLALSFVTIAELAAPLLNDDSRTNVMQLLNNLEELPHIFISGKIQISELHEAVEAFSNGREYSPIYPFVTRLDHTFEKDGAVATALFVNYSMAAIVWDLWRDAPEFFDGYRQHRPEFEATLSADRSLSNPPPLAEFFPTVIQRCLNDFEIPKPDLDTVELGDWIYSSRRRCPGFRLAFEVRHRLRSNRTDAPKASDLSDLSHLFYMPYVDLATLDRRMLGYLKQVLHEGKDYTVATCMLNASEVLENLLKF